MPNRKLWITFFDGMTTIHAPEHVFYIAFGVSGIADGHNFWDAPYRARPLLNERCGTVCAQCPRYLLARFSSRQFCFLQCSPTTYFSYR